MADSNFSNLKGEVVLLYSGGCDSTLSAAYLLEQHEKVTLLTLHTYFFQFFPDKTRILARKLQEKYGEDRVAHKFLDFHEFHSFSKDFVHYGFNSFLFVCYSCALAQLVAGIIFCLENGIHYLADGSTLRQQEHSYGTDVHGLSDKKEFAGEWGIEFLFPVFYVMNADKVLFNIGIISNKRLQSLQSPLNGYPVFLPTQQTCPIGLIRPLYKLGIYGPLFGTGKSHSLQRQYFVEKYRKEAQKYIEDYFERKKIDLSGLVKLNRLYFDKLKSKEMKKACGCEIPETTTICSKHGQARVLFPDLNDNKFLIPGRVAMDNLGCWVLAIGIIFGIAGWFLTQTVWIGTSLFFFIWGIFLYNHNLIRRRLNILFKRQLSITCSKGSSQ